jgi:serine/threonine-protein kinase
VILSGRYELLTRIGRGGMGQVWEGRDLLLGRKVAVKAVHLESVDGAALAERFQRESVATAALSHPGIVTVHDSGVDGDTAFLVMELVGGQDLARVVRDRGALPLTEAVRIGAAVAAALAAAHAIGVVHRDIKPANVLLDGERVKVVDFGIAALTHSAQTSLTAPGTTVGTAEYMSPEQAMARGVTPAADVYSLGCLLTTLLIGRPPFTGEHPLAVLNQQVQATPAPLRAALPDAPAELEQLLAAMLDKEPTARPSAADARTALARLRTFGPPPDAAATTEVAMPLVAGRPAKHPARTESPTTATRALPLPLAAIPPTRPQPATTAAEVPLSEAQAAPLARGAEATDAGIGRPRGRRRLIAIVGVSTALALVALGFSVGNRQPQAEPPPPVTTATPTPSPTPAPAPSPSPTPDPPAPQTLPAAVSALGSTISAIGQADEDSANAREDLLETFDKLVEEIEDDELGKAAAKARELARDVDKYVRDGQLGAAQAAPITTALDTVTTALTSAATTPADPAGSDD